MTACNMVAFDPQPHEYVAAKAFDKAQSFAGLAGGADGGRDRPVRQTLQDLFDQLEALLDLADADPDPSVDVAGLEHRHLKIELIVGRVAWAFARIEGAVAGTPHIAAGAELACEFRAQNAGGGGAVLQRSGVVVEVDELRENLPDLIQEPDKL